MKTVKHSPNTVWQHGHKTREERIKLLGRENKVLWFTGLSGSGKSTIAAEVESRLYSRGIASYTLDGDNVRHGLNSDLGFSKQDREENIRRISETARLFYDSGLFVLVCFISPYKKDRDFARKLIGKDFIEIHVKCPIEECEKRDIKGLYKKARAGEIKGFTGVDDPYEAPDRPEVIIDTREKGIEECADKIMGFLRL